MVADQFTAEWHGYVPEMVEWGKTGDYRQIRCEDAPARNANAVISRAMADISGWAAVSSAGCPFDRREYRGGCVLEVKVRSQVIKRAGGRDAIRQRLASVADRIVAELGADGWSCDQAPEVTAFADRPSEVRYGSTFRIAVNIHRAPAEVEVIACVR